MSSQGFDPAWALRPEGLQLVTRLVAAGRRNVVECGSGESTVAVARALRDLGGGHVHSLEHLPGWASRTRDVLASERLDRFATVIDAPLVDGWYDPAAADRLPEAGIDLLLVDGPPAGELGHERARYPALPRL
ncbi:MAG: class I SAM-dependent methyltransferase, partial [Solirubrobacterales bacterium]